ncbi:hypothetical protein PanWU01x14_113060, partial [Parasponia andersonii]
AMYLEQSLREVAWRPQGCWRMCFTDTNFKHLPSGDVIDKLMAEWGLRNDVVNGQANAYGYYGTSLFHGDYQVRVAHPLLKNNSSLYSLSLNVAPALLATTKRSTSLAHPSSCLIDKCFLMPKN